MLETFSTPMVFAHRGAKNYAPENTIAAFELAVEQGADAVELDAKLSADGKVMVIHDQTVDRTTDGKGKVNQLSLMDLKKLDAGSFFDHRFTGERIPTLDEVFESVGKKIFINVELTNYASRNDDLVPLVVDVVKRHGLQRSILFSSFFPINLRRAQTLLPEVPVGLLAWDGLLGTINRSSLYLDLSPKIVHPYLTDVNTRLMEREKKRGRRVHVWTVNEESDLVKMKEFGVDGVFTDDPVIALRVLRGK
jgi:glycerophosphoryl diester phosphodiesterase